MQRVAMMRTSLLKYGSPSRTAASKDLASAALDEASSAKPAAAAARASGSSCRGGGGAWRRRSAAAGKARRHASATAQLARSMNSSTIWLASRTVYMPTSSGSCVSRSISKRTSGEASWSAPRAARAARSRRASAASALSPTETSSAARASSSRACASAYVSAARERMTDFVKRVASTSALSGAISQITENARRSTPARSEQMSSVSAFGSMSRRRCTR